MAYGVPGLNMHALGMTQTLFGKGWKPQLGKGNSF